MDLLWVSCSIITSCWENVLDGMFNVETLNGCWKEPNTADWMSRITKKILRWAKLFWLKKKILFSQLCIRLIYLISSFYQSFQFQNAERFRQQMEMNIGNNWCPIVRSLKFLARRYAIWYLEQLGPLNDLKFISKMNCMFLRIFRQIICVKTFMIRSLKM